MPAVAAEVIGQLVRGDGEKIGLQFAAVVEVGQAVEEADEGFLHHVFTGVAVTDAALDESQQPALVARDQRLPGAGIAAADLLNQQTVALGGHWRYPTTHRLATMTTRMPMAAIRNRRV